ncbi:unnamed protein product [Auanema sp. JU1783]|nr:unnamed protein product [Auanema sp. JU1783]
MSNARYKEDDSSSYNTVEAQKEYEDPEYFYGGIGVAPSSASQSGARMVLSSPPPHPPPLRQPTHIAITNNKKKATPRWRLICSFAILIFICLILIISLVVFLTIGANNTGFFSQQNPVYTNGGEPVFPILPPETIRRADFEVTPNHLLTLMITKRKICVFEAGNGDATHSLAAFEQDHIESARLLFHSNLSHNGVPVHPLQFQRYARSLGVDNDCHVVIYDRGQVIWSTYAAWVFKLFGHPRVSLLGGGYLSWKTQQGRSHQYKTESGIPRRRGQGDFLSSWNDSLIITFDDVFLNTESGGFDIVDAQTKEEYHGVATGALYGHIRGSINIPVDTVYDWGTGQWLATSDLATVFENAGLSTNRPVIVYCSTSLRSSMIWWALTKAGYEARIYFGGWPEWVIRAPDSLKVLNAN